MPQTKKSNVPEGYKTTKGELNDIVALSEGEGVFGEYLGVKSLPSNFSKDGSILWRIKKDDGEVVLINEKATMQDIRLSSLKVGMRVGVVFNGWIQGKKRKYKDFEVFIHQEDLKDYGDNEDIPY